MSNAACLRRLVAASFHLVSCDDSTAFLNVVGIAMTSSSELWSEASGSQGAVNVYFRPVLVYSIGPAFSASYQRVLCRVLSLVRYLCVSWC